MARSSDAVFPLSLVRDRTFQMRQLRRVLWLTVFFIVQTTLLLGVFHHRLLSSLASGNAPLLFASEDLGVLSDGVPSVADAMGSWLLVMLLLNALVTGAIGVWIVRKLGNPLLALQRALNDIGEGKLDTRLRQGDAAEFAELSDAFNRALEAVQSRIDDARAATVALASLDEQPTPDPAAMRAALERCRTSLDWFEANARAAGDERRNAARRGR